MRRFGYDPADADADADADGSTMESPLTFGESIKTTLLVSTNKQVNTVVTPPLLAVLVQCTNARRAPRQASARASYPTNIPNVQLDWLYPCCAPCPEYMHAQGAWAHAAFTNSDMGHVVLIEALKWIWEEAMPEVTSTFHFASSQQE